MWWLLLNDNTIFDATDHGPERTLGELQLEMRFVLQRRKTLLPDTS